MYLLPLSQVMPQVEAIVAKLDGKYRGDEQVWLFPQTWGSTCLGFDGGSFAIGGSAMSNAHSIVVEGKTGYHCFFNERYAYTIPLRNARKIMEDLRSRHLLSQSKAKLFEDAEIRDYGFDRKKRKYVANT